MPTIVPTCPDGKAFEPDPVYDCMSCGLCVQFPNTGICLTQKCIDFLRKPVTEALQFSAQEEITDKPLTELSTTWVWIVVVCLVLSVIAVGTAVTVVIIRKKKKSIKGNREDKIEIQNRDVRPVPLPDITVEKLNFPVENTEPPSSETLDLEPAMASLDNVSLSGAGALN